MFQQCIYKKGGPVSVRCVSSPKCLWYCLYVCLCVCLSVSVCVCLSVRTIKRNGWNQNCQTWHRDGPSRYLAHQWILGQKVKGQGHRVKNLQKVATRQPCGAVSLHCNAAQRDGAARLASVMHSIECPASSCICRCLYHVWHLFCYRRYFSIICCIQAIILKFLTHV